FILRCEREALMRVYMGEHRKLLYNFWKSGFLALVLLVLFALPAHALTISSVDGTWGAVTGGYNINYYYDISVSYGNGLEDQVRWCTPVYPLSNEQSGLGFTGVAPPPVSFDIGEAFEIGQLRHFNNVIYGGPDSADLTISLVFSDPEGLSGTYDFTFQINETGNVPGSSDDIITFPSSYPEESYNIGGTLYTLQILGFGPDVDNLMDELVTHENETNSTLLWGKVTTTVVPAPYTLFLLGSGLIGLAGFRKKFRKS
ncbi:MAG: PEP-CTERM sorting domain-containing protein, partial [Deltaproteobacteria bacterium]|nr:PEP-CTERM sorting domain-containing protein [Deltaproteobacteria bacterium]